LSCYSLSWITFESDFHHRPIEKSAFLSSRLKSVVIPSSVQNFMRIMFWKLKSLSPATFEICSTVVESNQQHFTGIRRFLVFQNVLYGDLAPSWTARLLVRRDELTLGRMSNRQCGNHINFWFTL
jgi:hypothetical protein